MKGCVQFDVAICSIRKVERACSGRREGVAPTVIVRKGLEEVESTRCEPRTVRSPKWFHIFPLKAFWPSNRGYVHLVRIQSETEVAEL